MQHAFVTKLSFCFRCMKVGSDSMFKMAGMFTNLSKQAQCLVMRFLSAQGRKTDYIHWRMVAMYGEKSL